MLESLVPAEATAARQETTDISSAVIDGVDVFILSHETRIGHTPLNAAIFLAKSIAEAEHILDHALAYLDMRDQAISDDKPTVSEILCSTATAIALDNNVDMFVTVTKTG